MKSQNAQILNYLKTKKPLTTKDAQEMFSCYRLASRVYDLRSQGHPIVSETKKVGNAVIAEYRYAS
jgi:hypothetical protein